MIDFKVLLVSGLLLSVAAGQAEKPRNCPQRVAAGLRATVTSPTMRRHWAATGVGILAALPLDHRVQQWAASHGLMPEPMARFVYDWGQKWGPLGILPGIYIAEIVRGTPKNDRRQHLAFAFTSLAMVGITTEALKYATRRERPNKQASTAFPYGHSFPSGHASAAFGIAEVVRTLYGNRVGAAFYVMALVTGASRIHDNKHYLSDVVAGAGLGIGLVRGFDLAQRPGSSKDTLEVVLGPGRVIMRINF